MCVLGIMRTQNCVCVRVHCVYLFALRIFVSTCVSVDDSVYVCVYVCVYAYVHACVYACVRACVRDWGDGGGGSQLASFWLLTAEG